MIKLSSLLDQLSEPQSSPQFPTTPGQSEPNSQSETRPRSGAQFRIPIEVDCPWPQINSSRLADRFCGLIPQNAHPQWIYAPRFNDNFRQIWFSLPREIQEVLEFKFTVEPFAERMSPQAITLWMDQHSDLKIIFRASMVKAGPKQAIPFQTLGEKKQNEQTPALTLILILADSLTLNLVSLKSILRSRNREIQFDLILVQGHSVHSESSRAKILSHLSNSDFSWLWLSVGEAGQELTCAAQQARSPSLLFVQAGESVSDAFLATTVENLDSHPVVVWRKSKSLFSHLGSLFRQSPVRQQAAWLNFETRFFAVRQSLILASGGFLPQFHTDRFRLYFFAYNLFHKVTRDWQQQSAPLLNLVARALSPRIIINSTRSAGRTRAETNALFHEDHDLFFRLTLDLANLPRRELQNCGKSNRFRPFSPDFFSPFIDELTTRAFGPRPAVAAHDRRREKQISSNQATGAEQAPSVWPLAWRLKMLQYRILIKARDSHLQLLLTLTAPARIMRTQFTRIRSEAWRISQPYHWLKIRAWKIKQPFYLAKKLCWVGYEAVQKLKAQAWKIKLPYYSVAQVPLKLFHFIKERMWKLKLPWIWIRANAWRIRMPYYFFHQHGWKFRKKIRDLQASGERIFRYLARPLLKIYYFARYQISTRNPLRQISNPQKLSDQSK